MLFVEFRFLAFFLIVFGVYWTLRTNEQRKLWVLACSYFFYGCWNWKFLLLIAFSTTVDFLVGRALGNSADPRARRRWLLLSLCVNLGLLGAFKYCNFFLRSAQDFLTALGLHSHLGTLSVILPVGISFFTFQSLSYTIDVSRGHLRPVRRFTDLALAVSFFPQLVAGPITRAADFLPQLDRARRYAEVDVRACLVLFLSGFAKKACLSDAIAPTVDQFFAAPDHYGLLSAWLGVLLYAVQIYADFSGYTDMALACAGLLGYRLAWNFDFPYLAPDIGQFWRRWHMSLSSWLRDYLYIPLGGNRGGRWFVARNLLVTMILGGLWHGAAWHFVGWGGLHGVALVIHREWTRRFRIVRRAHRLPSRWRVQASDQRTDANVKSSRPVTAGGAPALQPEKSDAPNWQKVAATLLTFYWVSLSWVFFRAPDLPTAGVVLRAFLLCRAGGTQRLPGEELFFILFACLALVHWLNARQTFAGLWERLPDWAFAAVYGVAVAVTLLFVPQHYAPFIYFQF